MEYFYGAHPDDEDENDGGGEMEDQDEEGEEQEQGEQEEELDEDEEEEEYEPLIRRRHGPTVQQPDMAYRNNNLGVHSDSESDEHIEVSSDDEETETVTSKQRPIQNR